MFAAIAILTVIGLALGLGLGAANRYLPVQEDPLVERIAEMLPGTQCGQCGFAGCRQAAVALVEDNASLSLCPPGGPGLAQQLSTVLGRESEAVNEPTRGPNLAWVNRDLCIGCTKCIRHCPTDALVGAAKQIHVVLEDACTGCGACEEVCPTAGIVLQQVPLTLSNWHWPKPGTNPSPSSESTVSSEPSVSSGPASSSESAFRSKTKLSLPRQAQSA